METQFVTPKAKRSSLSNLNTQDTLAKSSPKTHFSPSDLFTAKLHFQPSPPKTPQTPLGCSQDKATSVKPESPLKPLRSEPSRPYQLLALGLFAFICIAVSLDYLSVYFTTPSYCDTHQVCPPETQCPPNGFCIGGSLKCAQGYFQSHSVCVEDSALGRSTYKALDVLQDLVGSQAVEACETSLCSVLSVKSAEFLLGAQGFNTAQVMPRLTEAIRHRLGTSLQITEVDGVEVFEAEAKQVVSPVVLRGVIVMGVLGLVKVVLAVQAAYSAYRAKQLYSQVRRLVLDSPEGVPEQHIKEQLYYQVHFNLENWPLIEALRRADLSICRFEAIKGAKPMIYWQKRGRVELIDLV
jgi:hypothetical protein